MSVDLWVKYVTSVCVLEYSDEYMQMDASGVPRTQEARVSFLI